MLKYFSAVTCLVGLTFVLSGCGSTEYPTEADMTDNAELGSMDEGDDGSAAGVAETKPVDLKTIKSEDFKRRIVRTGEMELHVEDFSQVPSTVSELVNKYTGYIASSNVTGSTGSTRHGTWTLRVPSERFEEFLDELEHSGELQSRHTNSREVTTEYYDVASRIRNQQSEEERLLKHLEGSTGRLDDILTVEREITRVRGQLELLQGRMRMLEDVTSLSTVTLTVREILAFTPAESPAFATRVSRTFETTKANLTATGQAIVIFLIGFGPWIIILVVPLTIAFYMGRRLLRGTVTSISNP